MKTQSLVNFFMKYFVRSPILFFILVSISFCLFLFFSFKIEYPVYITKSATLSADKKEIIVEDINNTQLIRVYAYTNKNEIVYRIHNFQIKNNMLSFKTNNLLKADEKSIDNSKIYVDIETETTNLFNQLFIKGGK